MFLIVSIVALLGPPPADPPPASTVDRTLDVRGARRNYRVFVPSGQPTPMPAIIAFHGEGGSSKTVESYTRLDDLAASEGFVAIYPQGVGNNWDYGPGLPVVRSRGFGALMSDDDAAAIDAANDDIAFVRSIVDELAGDDVVDRSRVFATGISSGAMFCHRLAAEASDLVAAIAPVSGGMAVPVAAEFAPDYPVSFVTIVGMDDPVMPAAGGPVAAILPKDRGRVAPIDETIADYLRLDGIEGGPTVAEVPDASEDDGTKTTHSTYPPGRDGFLVEVYRVDGGGHNWPGRPLNYHVELVGLASQDFDGSVAIWDFLKRCPPRTIAE